MQWISVKDRLPKKNGQKCLIYPIDGEAETATWCSPDGWNMWDFFVSPNTIIHWLMLDIEPPKI